MSSPPLKVSSSTKKIHFDSRNSDNCLCSSLFHLNSSPSLMGLPAETTESHITQNRDLKKPSLTETSTGDFLPFGMSDPSFSSAFFTKMNSGASLTPRVQQTWISVSCAARVNSINVSHEDEALKSKDLLNNVVSIPGKIAETYSPGTWKLPVGSIQPVPMYYLLERTSKFIQNSSSSDIAIRISECLRKLSISAFYHDKKAKAKCRTDERVEFRIRIFSSIDQFSQGIIVEIQRRNGHSMKFQQDCCAILSAAEGSLENNYIATKSSVPHFALLKFPYVDDHTAQVDFDTFFRKDAYKLVQNLLEQDQMDANILGMQYLCSLTNFSISGSKDAKLGQSFKVLFSEDFPERRHLVIDLVQHRRYHPKEKEIEEVAMEYLDYLRDLALQVLTNEVDEMATKGLLTQALKHHRWPIDHLVQCLIFELKESTAKPHEASLAAKCLHRLINASPEALLKAVELGIIEAVCHAMEIGKESHAILVEEAKKCATTLDCN